MGRDRKDEELRRREFDHILGNLSPENSSVPPIANSNSPIDVHLVCIGCESAVALPANFLNQPSLASHCALCEEPISVEMIYTSDDMSVLELKGCEYGRPGIQGHFRSLIDNNQTRPDSNPFGRDDKSFVDNLLAHWEVRTKSGEVFHFEYFSAVRKWISEGRLKAGDEIIPADGRHYRLEIYPGTADLFGNIFLRNEAKAGMLDRVPTVRPRVPKKKIIWTHVILTLGLAIAAGITPDVIQSIRIRTGDKLIRRLVQLETPVAPERYLTEVLNANDHFRRGTFEDLKLAEKSYLRTLALKPNDPEVIGGLVETWVESSEKTSPILDTGSALLRYAQARFPGNRYILRATARLEHKKGESANALRDLNRVLRKDPNDPDTHALIASIAMDQGDFTTATLHLDQSLQLDPTNLTVVKTFVTLFERQSKFREAAAYLRRVASLSGEPSRYTDQLAELYTKANDPAAVEAIYREAMRSASDREKYHALLVELLSSQKRTEDVIRESLSYLERFPNGENVLKVRAFYNAVLDSTNTISTSTRESSTPSRSDRPAYRANRSHRR